MDHLDDELFSLGESLKDFEMDENCPGPIPAHINELISKKDYNETQLSWIKKIPWLKTDVPEIDINKAKKIINESHYGLDRVKQRILEYISIQKRNGSDFGGNLLLYGPPGVGKASIAESIAKAMNRKFVNISLDGMSAALELKGSDATSAKPQPGIIARALIEAGTMSPVICFDEIDKMRHSYQHGSPETVFIELFDGCRNRFVDTFLDVPLDLSNAVFIATANSIDKLSKPLLDRMEIVHLSGYTNEEKKVIMTNYLIPKYIKMYNLDNSKIEFEDSAIDYLINKYCSTPGVRELEICIKRIFERYMFYMVNHNKGNIKFDISFVSEVLEPEKKREHFNTITKYNELAELYYEQGKYKESEELYKKVLEIEERELGKEHPDTLTTYNNLAVLCYEQGRYKEAEELLKKVLEIRERELGKEHPDTLKTYNNLAELYHAQGRYEESEELYKKVLEIRERELGKEHLATILTYGNLAVLYYAQGRYEESEELYKKVLEIRERELGKEHSDTLATYNNLAVLYCAQGRYEESEELYKKLLEIEERKMGKGHPYTLKMYNNLLGLYEEQGRYEETEELLKKVLEIEEKELGEEHPCTLTTYNNLAGLYKNQGRYKEAEELLRKVLKIEERELGKEHPNTLITYSNLAVLYFDQGRYEETEELYKKVLEIEERELGKEHPYTLTMYSKLAGLYEKQGRYKELEELYKRVLKIEERELGKEYPYTLTMYNNLAELYKDQGRYEELEELYKRVLEIEERELGEEHPYTLTTYSNLAELYKDQGRYEESEELYKRVLEIKERKLGKEHPYTITTYNNLAVLYENQGRYKEAEEQYKRALKIIERELGKEHPETLKMYNNLAVLYYAQGRYEESEEQYKKVLEIIERGLGKEHPYTITTYNNLAVLYEKKRRYKESEELYKKVMEIRERELGKEHPETLKTYNNLAALYEKQGRYEESEELYKKVIEIRERELGKEHPETLKTYNNLAVLYENQGRYEESEELFKKVLEIWERELGKEHLYTLTTYNNLAGLYHAQGRYEESEELYKRVLEIRERELGKEYPETLITYNNLAGLYCAQGRYEESEELFKKVLEIWERELGKEHPYTSATYNNLAALYQKQGRYEEALKQMYKGLLAIGKAIQTANYIASKKSAKAIKIENLIYYEAYLCILRNIRNPHYSYLIPLFTMKQGEIYSSNLKNLLFKQHANGEQKALWIRLMNDFKRIEGELVALQNNEIKEQKRIKKKMEEKNKLEDKLWALENEVLPSLNTLRDFERAEPEALLKLLPPNEIVIEFFKYRNVADNYRAEYCVLIVDPKDVYKMRLVNLGDADMIDLGIILFRSQITLNSKDNIHLIKDLKKKLYNILIKPIEEYLNEWDKVCICPDGELTRLPFEVLIEDKHVRYMGSIGDIIWLNIQGGVVENKGVVAANANYDAIIKPISNNTHSVERMSNAMINALERSDAPFNELLPFEGYFVWDILKQKCSEVDLLQNETFIKSNFLKIKSPKVLHISTHGFFCENTDYIFYLKSIFNLKSETFDDFETKISKFEDPMDRSGLALTGANSALKDETLNEGIVTARDISKMELMGTELAVLSACETGLGEVKVGDGVYGLQRAFFISGVKTLVMSLWKVDDIATTLLMENFYKHLVEGERIDISLKLAKTYLKEMNIEEVECNYLKLLKRYMPDITDEDVEKVSQWLYSNYSDKPFSHPFYWAGFICMGAGGRIDFH